MAVLVEVTLGRIPVALEEVEAPAQMEALEAMLQTAPVEMGAQGLHLPFLEFLLLTQVVVGEVATIQQVEQVGLVAVEMELGMIQLPRLEQLILAAAAEAAVD